MYICTLSSVSMITSFFKQNSFDQSRGIDKKNSIINIDYYYYREKLTIIMLTQLSIIHYSINNTHYHTAATHHHRHEKSPSLHCIPPQDDKDLVHEFVLNDGLDQLMSLAFKTTSALLIHILRGMCFCCYYFIIIIIIVFVVIYIIFMFFLIFLIIITFVSANIIFFIMNAVFVVHNVS